jgi:hypothetical protein
MGFYAAISAFTIKNQVRFPNFIFLYFLVLTFEVFTLTQSTESAIYARTQSWHSDWLNRFLKFFLFKFV